MWKCSFLAAAAAVGVLSCLLQKGAYAQEYDVGEPNGDVSFTGVQGSNVALLFDQREVIVNPGESLNLDCGIEGEYRYCVWEAPLETYQVEDVYTNLYPGLSKPEVSQGNECGIVLRGVDTTHHGQWTCKVYIRGNNLVGSKNVVVTVKPTRPILEVDTSQGVLEVSSDEESNIKCTVAGARPAVRIRWFLGDSDVSFSAQTEETPADGDGIYKSVSTLRHTFDPSENGRNLMCSVSHQTLLAPENATIPISVIFKPVAKALSTFYQVVPGSNYEIQFNFSANPVPTRIEWRYGESFQNMATSIPVPGVVDRYTAYELEGIAPGHYSAKLFISDFTVADANQRYMLVVENRQGATEYEIKLSMDEAPIDGDSESRDHDKFPTTELSVSEDALSGGAVAGIIIVVLIVVVAVVAAGYARYRQMFCFAPAAAVDPEEGKDIKEEHSDTESARGPHTTTHAASLKNSLGKLTQVFKKPKKDQDTKLEEGVEGGDEKKQLNKDEPKKEQTGDEKEHPGITQIPEDAITQIPQETTDVKTNKEVKSPEVKQQQTDDKKVEIKGSQPNTDKKPTQEKNEVVYAELDLSKGDGEKKPELKTEEKTEYAQIIGTVTDNKEEEKKE